MSILGVSSTPVPTRTKWCFQVAEDAFSGACVVWKIHLGRPLSYGSRIALLGRHLCLFECP